MKARLPLSAEADFLKSSDSWRPKKKKHAHVCVADGSIEYAVYTLQVYTYNMYKIYKHITPSAYQYVYIDLQSHSY